MTPTKFKKAYDPRRTQPSLYIAKDCQSTPLWRAERTENRMVELKWFHTLWITCTFVLLILMHYTEIVEVSPPPSPPSLALPKPVQDNTAQPPLSSSVETIASILVALFLLAIATAVVFVYRWRFGQSAKNKHTESEIALVQGTDTYRLILVFTITSDLVNYS